ncbi:hypothetical protein Taro_014072 [Colocasia esculenta]|uniref:Uncharacterized protein n=1 Tax=Colocasia esculenta TaxID=4460 RepID=A0A843UDQ2_COLES|nr:hypothetical protein [Colocasia esculenta]
MIIGDFHLIRVFPQHPRKSPLGRRPKEINAWTKGKDKKGKDQLSAPGKYLRTQSVRWILGEEEERSTSSIGEVPKDTIR